MHYKLPKCQRDLLEIYSRPAAEVHKAQPLCEGNKSGSGGFLVPAYQRIVIGFISEIWQEYQSNRYGKHTKQSTL